MSCLVDMKSLTDVDFGDNPWCYEHDDGLNRFKEDAANPVKVLEPGKV